MQVLNISSNRMYTLLTQSFIEQLGGRAALHGKFSSIISLNVSDNPISNILAMVDDINLLMPNLRDLQISLFAEKDVDLII